MSRRLSWRPTCIPHDPSPSASGLGLAPLGWAAASVAAAPETWHMPDGGDPHRATWMSFGVSEKVWGRRPLTPAREHLARIARTIAEFEPVHLLVREQEHDLAARLCGNRVQLEVQPVDDLWMRDTGPVFVRMPRARGPASTSTSTDGAASRRMRATPR